MEELREEAEGGSWCQKAMVVIIRLKGLDK